MKKMLASIWRKLGLSKRVQLWVMKRIQDQFLVGVTGVVFDDQNRVMLFKHTYRQTQWSLPGGYLKGREHPVEGLEREIKEESGLTVSMNRHLKLRTDRDDARLDICYVGQFIGGTFRKSTEVCEMGFFKFEELPNIARSQVLMIYEALKERSIETPMNIPKPKRWWGKIFKSPDNPPSMEPDTHKPKFHL